MNDKCRCRGDDRIRDKLSGIKLPIYCYCPIAHDYYCPNCGAEEKKDWSNADEVII